MGLIIKEYHKESDNINSKKSRDRVKKYIILLFVFFIQISYVNATNYYVSSSEGDDSNNGTSLDKPWKSLKKVNNEMNLYNPGDSILFKRGDIWKDDDIHSIFFKCNGSDSKEIIFSAYGNGKKPTFDGKGIDPFYLSVRGDFITFSYLKIINKISGGIGGESWADHVTFDSLEIINTGSNGIIMNGSYITYRRLHLKNIRQVGLGIFGCEDNVKPSNTLMEYCTLENIANDCISWHEGGGGNVLGNNHIIRYNKIDSCGIGLPAKNGVDGTKGHDGNFDITSGKNFKIYGNIIEDCHNSSIVTGHSADSILIERNIIRYEGNLPDHAYGMYLSNDSSYVRYNYLYNTDVGVAITGKGHKSDIKIYNNTFINMNRASIWLFQDNIEHLEIKNNLTYNKRFTRHLMNSSNRNFDYSNWNINNNIYYNKDEKTRFVYNRKKQMHFSEYQSRFEQGFNSKFIKPKIISISDRGYKYISKDNIKNGDPNILIGEPNVIDINGNPVTDKNGSIVGNGRVDIGCYQTAPPEMILNKEKVIFKTKKTKSTILKNIEITNNGESILNISNIKINGTDSSEFKIKNGSTSYEIKNGETANIEIEFSPQSKGSKKSKLKILSNDYRNPEYLIDIRGDCGNSPKLQIKLP